jgi:hypothetical protein
MNTSRSADDLVRMAQPTTAEQARHLLAFSQLIHDNPALLDQITTLVYSRVRSNERDGHMKAASVKEACHRLRWDNRVHISESIIALIARAVLYIHPDLGGVVEVCSSVLFDEMLGMRIAGKKLPSDHARRLEWADGRPLTEAITQKKPVSSVTAVPAQDELFGEVA